MEFIAKHLFPLPKHLLLDDPAQFCHIKITLDSIPTVIKQTCENQKIAYFKNDTLSIQAFRLTIQQHVITIEYRCELGKLYAHYALRQLKQGYPYNLPCLVITDEPSFEKRGVLLDISRDKIPTLEKLFQLIDNWSELRYNQLQLYTEHTFAYQSHQTVWQNYSPYHAKDIQQINEYCHQKGLELIPNQATFGHMEKWLCHPEYQHLAEQTDGFYDQRGDFRPQSFGLNPVNPDVPVFIRSLFNELLPNFTSKTLNINFDETMDLGVSGSKKACNQKGKGAVYLEYLHNVVSMVQQAYAEQSTTKQQFTIEQQGMTCQIFSDMLFQYPEILPHLPKNLELLNWGYEEDHPYDEEHQQIAKYGYPFQVVVSTNCFASVIGRRQASEVHMRRAAISAKKFGATGYMVSEWGDMGHAQSFYAPLPGYIFGAAMAWGEEQHPTVHTHEVLSRQFPNESESLIALLLQLQNRYLHSGVNTPNCAFYGPFVFDQISQRHIKRATFKDGDSLTLSISQLEMDAKQLQQVPSSPLQQHLIWSVQVMLLASYIALYYQQQETRDLTMLTCESKAHLSRLLAPVKSNYLRLWQEDYRIGGYQQSYSRLLILEKAILQKETIHPF
ncbi:family 20 glycosylhydrolase [Vibrio casei]|uniref:Beta-N-acetylhexosaminidase n=1 Tax=Vibrio casei TaxID=673372 RepID=A0A368LP10_9VIBR|nr:family 20 glycosylhydrolase [Vibrio casei]RCS73612.1 beta-N-acetylhexosaminidase [Vibrio casei]SJN16911.1 Beta-hexosaminidase [Vibrio casei]